MKILLLGMNHRTAPLEVRERFAVAEPAAALQKLATYDEVEEAVLLSTCNRVEVVVTTRQEPAARLLLRHFFERELARGASPGEPLADYVYEYADGEAVRHVFRVSSSLDAMIVGEPQILGQSKDAYRAAVDTGTCGPVLARLFQQAFATAKRVRTETGVAERPVSVARVAVDLARQIFEDLRDKKALLLGAGEMIESALDALRQEGLVSLRVANRTRSRAEELAERFGATPHGLDELDALLPAADVILTSIGGDGPLLSLPCIERALERRRNRPIFVIDLGVPRNVDAQVNGLDNVFLYDVDDLQDVTAANVEQRRRESERAERIVEQEQERFEGWLVALQAVPTIRDLRSFADSVRRRELERQLGRLGLDDAQAEGVERLTRAIVNKLLHAPLTRLRAETGREEGIAMLEATRALFGLDSAAAPDDADAGRGPDREPDPEG